jgi:fatty-acyl-CoA synthase
MLAARATDDQIGLLYEENAWTWSGVVSESLTRAEAALALREEGPFHIGVLLDNVPEYLFWMGGAALCGAVVVGINPTRRGEELARDIRFTECQIIVTDGAGFGLIDGLEVGVDPSRILRVDQGVGSTTGCEVGGPVEDRLAAMPEVSAADLYMLIFTSGTTGSPKAVRCTQGR